MAVTSFGGTILIPSPITPSAAAPAFAAISTMSAGTHKTAYIIRAPKAGTLDWFEARQHANTNNPDNGLRFSFQNMSLTTGDPDGTQDQYRAVTAGFGAGAWLVPPGVMTSDGTDTGTKRTVVLGEILCCVVEFESFVAGDSIQMSAIAAPNSSSGHGTNSKYIDAFGASWTKAADYAPIALKYSDSTYGILLPSVPAVTINTRTFGSGASPNIRGILFEAVEPWQVCGAWVRIDGDGDFEVRLYDSADTLLADQSSDLNNRQNTAGNTVFLEFDTLVELVQGDDYRLVIVPSSATTVSIYDYNVSTAALRSAFPFGASRQSTVGPVGTWVDLDTNYGPEMGLIVNGRTTASGGGTRGYFSVG